MDGTPNTPPIYRNSIWVIERDEKRYTVLRKQALQEGFHGALTGEHDRVFTPRMPPFCWITGKGLIGGDPGRQRGTNTSGPVRLQAHHIVPVDYVLERIMLSINHNIVDRYIQHGKKGKIDPSSIPNQELKEMQIIQNLIKYTYTEVNGVLISSKLHQKIHEKCGNNPGILIKFLRDRCLQTYENLQNNKIRINTQFIVVDGIQRSREYIVNQWAQLMIGKGLLPKENRQYEDTFLEKLEKFLEILKKQTPEACYTLRR
jgi:hypothetical protein